MRPLCLLALLSSVASAQGFELERLVLNPGARETWLAQSGDGLAPQTLRVALLGHYQHRPLVYTVDGVEVGAAIASRWTAHLVAAYGLHEFLELGLQVPVVLSQSGDDLSAYGVPPVTATALGAPWVTVRSTVLRQSAGKPMDAAVSIGLGLPFGVSAAYTKDPELGIAVAPRLGVGHDFGGVRLGGEVGVLFRGTQTLSPTSAAVSDVVGNLLSGALVLSTSGFAVHGELAARVTVPFTNSPASLEVLAAVRGTVGKQFELSLMGGPGIGKAPGTPAFRVLAGLTWTPDFSAPAEPTTAEEPAT